MALFTTTDRDAIKTALITAATEGVASVSIGGQSVTTYTLEQLQKLLQMVQADIGATDLTGGVAVTPFPMVKTIPPSPG